VGKNVIRLLAVLGLLVGLSTGPADAAELKGDAHTQNNLGLMYAHGQGVPQDYVLAHMWFNLSATQGHQ
jgi:uncharacterized protein